MKKKVLFILPYWIKGGAEKQFRYIYEGISKEHEVDILLLNEDNSNILELNNKFYIKNYLFEEKNKFMKIVLRLYSYIKIYMYIKLKLSQYDVAIGHNKLLIPIMPMLKSKCNKVIFSAREADKDFTKGYVRKIISKLDMITCNSKATYEILKNVNENLVYINNGVEINENVNTPKIKQVKNIGIIANISRRKNVKIVIQALDSLPKDIIINIAGKVPDNHFYKELKKYIKEKSLEERVNFLGYINDMDKFYINSDIIILPSLYEGTSNVILESFSRKKLILMSDIPENTYLVRDIYKDILVFNPKDSKELADKVNQIIQIISKDNNVLQEILINNYKLVITEYSIESLKQKYLNIIN